MKSILVYFGNYVNRKNESNANDTFNYVEQFGRFICVLNREGLNIPSGSIL